MITYVCVTEEAGKELPAVTGGDNVSAEADLIPGCWSHFCF